MPESFSSNKIERGEGLLSIIKMQEGLTLCSAVINISWNQNQQCMQTSLSGYFFGLQNVSLPVLSWLRGDGLAHQVPGPNVLRAEENSRGSVGGRGHVCH